MSLPRLFASPATLGLKLFAGLVIGGLELPALAQVESFLWGPGSNVGPETKVEPQNCVTGPDGSITCDTKVVNPPGDTPAKPQYRPFSY
ncbi:hypothetical protein KUL97_09180 [Synechococcus sp. HK05]|jgi:hypothetical protein|uniref:hypothetical protein n=1 Tax=Synechococcus sp. HK05 TaxID=2725975 RepID=UPI001C384E99|nr:hypothetical protein [Synechococcus sp. HK05]MBV2351877.1 hypothetical protein [Synechococcus sp. HK05]